MAEPLTKKDLLEALATTKAEILVATRKDLTSALATTKAEILVATRKDLTSALATTKAEILVATRKDLANGLAGMKRELTQEFTTALASTKTEFTAALASTKTELKAELKEFITAQFVNERRYYTQFVATELADIRRQLERIESSIGGDARGALIDLDTVKNRLTKVEAIVAKLQAA